MAPLISWPVISGAESYRVVIVDSETGDRKTIYRGTGAQVALPEEFSARLDKLRYRVDARESANAPYATHVPYAECSDTQSAENTAQVVTIDCPADPDSTAYRLVVRADEASEPLVDRTRVTGPFVLDLSTLTKGTRLRYRVLGFRQGEWVPLDRFRPVASGQASGNAAPVAKPGIPAPGESAVASWDDLARFPIEWQGKRILNFGRMSAALARQMIEEGAAVEVHVVGAAGQDAGTTGAGRLRSFGGDLLELPELRDASYDIVCSFDELMYLDPLRFERTICWFWDHLKPGGAALLRVRTVFFNDGGGRPYLAPSDMKVMPYCGATYLLHYRSAGFDIVEASRTGGDPVSAKGKSGSRFYDPVEESTDYLTVLLRKPHIALDVKLIKEKLL